MIDDDNGNNNYFYHRSASSSNKLITHQGNTTKTSNLANTAHNINKNHNKISIINNSNVELLPSSANTLVKNYLPSEKMILRMKLTDANT